MLVPPGTGRGFKSQKQQQVLAQSGVAASTGWRQGGTSPDLVFDSGSQRQAVSSQNPTFSRLCKLWALPVITAHWCGTRAVCGCPPGCRWPSPRSRSPTIFIVEGPRSSLGSPSHSGRGQEMPPAAGPCVCCRLAKKPEPAAGKETLGGSTQEGWKEQQWLGRRPRSPAVREGACDPRKWPT